METSKKPWQSRTILTNAVLAVLAGVSMLLPNTSGISVFITSHADTIGLLWGVLNIGLRAITKDKISLTD